MRFVAAVALIVTSGCTSSAGGTGGGDVADAALDGSSEGSAASTQAKACGQSVTAACADNLSCVLSYDKAVLCASWPSGFSRDVVPECGGYHVVLLWNGDVAPLISFYDLSDGHLVAVGYSQDDGHGNGRIDCYGGPAALTLPQKCLAMQNAQPCTSSDAGGD